MSEIYKANVDPEEILPGDLVRRTRRKPGLTRTDVFTAKRVRTRPVEGVPHILSEHGSPIPLESRLPGEAVSWDIIERPKPTEAQAGDNRADEGRRLYWPVLVTEEDQGQALFPFGARGVGQGWADRVACGEAEILWEPK